MAKVWTVLQANTDASRSAIKAAGCTHAVVEVHWREIQPTTTGTLDASRLAQLKSDFANCKTLGLKVILSINLHYAPVWVLSGVEQFKDHLGNNYADTNYGAGKAVRNWMWTQTGRNYVSDVITRIGAALTTDEKKQVVGCRLGGGWYGELHYPESVSGPGTLAWQGFSASMQNGTDLATGMTVCPNPGYVPYTGTDAQDCQWLNWYLNGIVAFGVWLIAQHKAAGFNKNLWLLLPGYGIRSNQARSSGGYKQAAALGEDHARAIGAIMHDSVVWPYSTWINTFDGFAGGTVDSDISAWKSMFNKAYARGKHWRLIGENTGGESNTDMNNIFSGSLGNAAFAGQMGAPYNNGFLQGCVWLSYPSLTSGGGNATLANYGINITSKGNM